MNACAVYGAPLEIDNELLSVGVCIGESFHCLIAHLDSRLLQCDATCYIFACVTVRVARLSKQFLQDVEL